jgi:hypothetical protein
LRSGKPKRKPPNVLSNTVRKKITGECPPLLAGRTDNAIKNHLNSKLRRKYAEVGLYKLNAVVTHSLKAPGFEELLFLKFNLYRYA